MADANIELEVQRRLAAEKKALNDEIASQQKIIETCRDNLVRQHNVINRLTGDALIYGTLLRVHNYPDKARFRHQDEVLVVDQKSPHFQRGGVIISGDNDEPVVDEEGFCLVKLNNGAEQRFSIGMEGKAPAQIRLTTKDDGTTAVVNVEGKIWEVRGVPDLSCVEGQTVKVRADNKAIIGTATPFNTGPICQVSTVTEFGVEVLLNNQRHLVRNPKNFPLVENDRIVTDPTMCFIVEKLAKEDLDKYKLDIDFNVNWDDVGGLVSAKQELRELIELPYTHGELLKFYNVKPLRGAVLFGPPGCGKTLLARAAAAAMARQHGKKAAQSGYIFVKAPEILDKWVGNSEAAIRDLFERARKHYRENGFKAILAIDEADAIMSQRGVRRSSDINDTLVPMFLGEMDGISPKDTEENPFVLLMTNRVDTLDPAVVRPGRISAHIKIDRPNEETAIDILDIHTRNMPFRNAAMRLVSLTTAVTDMFSKTRLLYRVNNEHDFTLGHCVNGAMLESVAEKAKKLAFRRDMDSGTMSGVSTEDLRDAVDAVYHEQKGLNHSYDLADFCESIGVRPDKASFDRCFGSK